MKNAILTAAISALLIGGVMTPTMASEAKESCKKEYKEEMHAAKQKKTHEERREAEKAAKMHLKECKEKAKH